MTKSTRNTSRPRDLKALVQTLHRTGIALLLLAIVALPSFGADVSWLGNTDANWGTAANWQSGTPTGNRPVFDVAGTSGTSLNNNLTATSAIAGMLFNATAPSYTIAGNAIQLTDNITNNSTNAQVIDLDMELTAKRYVYGADTASTTLSGDISGANELEFRRSGGTSYFTLSGNNSYTGKTTVYQGAYLYVTSATALGTSGTLEVNSASFSNDSGVDLAVDNLRTVNAASMYLANGLSTDTATLTGPTSYRIYSGVLTVGTIVGTSSLYKSNPGTLDITGSSPGFSGPFTHGGGTLILGANDSLGSITNLPFSTATLEASNDLSGANKLGFTINMTSSAGTYAGDHTIELGNTLTTSFTSGRNVVINNNIVSGKKLIIDDIDGITHAATRWLQFKGDGDTDINGTVAETAGGTVRLEKYGSGVMTLAGSNTYTLETYLNDDGMLRLENTNAIPGGIGASGGTSNLYVLGTGVIGLGTDSFYRGLGTGTDQVRFADGGGFAAYNADRVVNLGGASAAVTWGSASFISGTMILGAEDATHTVDFQNPIALGNNATRTVRVDDGADDFDAILSGLLSGTGTSGLNKTGDGTLVLSAGNSYTGTTAVGAGTLLVNGSIAGNATVSAGASLGGTGTINGDVAVASGGNLAPGASVGTLTINGDLDLADNSTLTFELGPGTTGDVIRILNYTPGDLAIGSNVVIDFINTSNLARDTYYPLFEFYADGGTTATAHELGSGFLLGLIPSAPPAVAFDFTGDPNQIRLYVVPEPTSLALLGFASLMMLRRRRN